MDQIFFWAHTTQYVVTACAVVTIAVALFYRLTHSRRREGEFVMLASPRAERRFDIPSIRMDRLAAAAAERRPIREDDVAGVLNRVKYDLERLRFALLEQKGVHIRKGVESELKNILMRTHPQVFAN